MGPLGAPQAPLGSLANIKCVAADIMHVAVDHKYFFKFYWR